jgi:hypothetical protein
MTGEVSARVAVVVTVFVTLAVSQAIATNTCLTGTDPAGDAAQISAVRAVIDAACACSGFDGSKGKTHVNYVKCAKDIITAQTPTNLRPQCTGTVKKFYSNSTCGVNPMLHVAPCVRKSQKSGAVTCSIKSTTACGNSPAFTQVACPAYTTCIDAADTNHDLVIAAPGDTGGCVPIATGSLASAPLSGCAITDYSAAVTVGGQTFQLLVDSGSTTTGVASDGCHNCGVSPLFHAGANTADTQQTVSAFYGDGSGWSGRALGDDASVAGLAPLGLTFAAIDSQSNGFFTAGNCIVGAPLRMNDQGILGLGPADLALSPTQGYLDNLAQRGGTADVFSVQLCGVGGRIWFGGYDPAYTTATPQYTAMVASPYYAVTVSDVLAGGTSLGYGATTFGPSLVDTGTTAFFVPDNVFTSLTSTVAANATFALNFGGASWFTNGFCTTPNNGLTAAQLDAALPTLTLKFPSSTPAGFISVQLLATESYLLRIEDTMGNAFYCPAVFPSTMTIIGGNMMRSQITIFDRQGSQIGFAPRQSCPGQATSLLARSAAVGGPVLRIPLPPHLSSPRHRLSRATR